MEGKLRLLLDYGDGSDIDIVNGELAIRKLAAEITLDTIKLFGEDMHKKIDNPEDEVFMGIRVCDDLTSTIIKMYDDYLVSVDPEGGEKMAHATTKVLKSLS